MNSVNTAYTGRMSGLASGMDIDAIVKDMMTVARMPLDKLQQEKQVLEWQQEDYRGLNTALYEFRTKLFEMKLSSTMNMHLASLSNNNIAAVKGSGITIEGIYELTVNQLASGVSKISTGVLAGEKDGEGKTLTLFNQFSEFAARGLTADDKITINLNGTEIEFDLGADNINTVVAKINNAEAGVRANYDSLQKRFFLNTAGSGSSAEINITSDTANFLAAGSNDSILKLNINEGENYRGQNASVDFGDAVGLESESNAITINGLSIELKNSGSTVITVSRDIDSTVNAVKDLVDSYNNILNALNEKIQEKRDREFPPLTEAQRKDMSEDEIKKWEAKARIGLLRNDFMLQNLVDTVRTTMTGMIVGNDSLALSRIGITTGPYAENGKLHVDADLLREAVTRDPESVRQMMEATSGSLYEVCSNGIKYLSDQAGSSTSLSAVDESYIGKMLTDKKEAIEKWEKKLGEIEKRYYSQFTLMETFINQMNSQSAWLSAQFSSMM